MEHLPTSVPVSGPERQESTHTGYKE